jgi:hypothetical protein
MTVNCDAHLAVGDLLKSRGDILGSDLIRKALEEWMHTLRRDRLQLVRDTYLEPRELEHGEGVLEIRKGLPAFYFVEPDFADASQSASLSGR